MKRQHCLSRSYGFAFLVLIGEAFFAIPSSAGFDGNLVGYCAVDNTRLDINADLLGTEEVAVSECLQFSIPKTKGLIKYTLDVSPDSTCRDLEGSWNWSALTTPQGMANWAVKRIGRLSPPFPLLPCPPTEVTNYGRLSGGQRASTISIGSLFFDGPIVVKQLSSEMSWTDTVEIFSEVPRSIALPVHISGSVYAAESFGTELTGGYAKLTMTGTVAGVAINETVEVVSESPIPEEASINVSQLAQISVQAGRTVISFDVTGVAEIRSTAQGAAFVTGASTAAVEFPNSMELGRFSNFDGGPLPGGIFVRSIESGLVFENWTVPEASGNILFSSGLVGLCAFGRLRSRESRRMLIKSGVAEAEAQGEEE